MAESLRSPNIYQPKSVAEVLSIKIRHPETVLWGGGTYLMTRPDYYPDLKAKDIIRLASVPELSRIQHSDRYMEVGSMVTIQHLLNNGNAFLAKPVIKALSEIGSSVIRTTATVGGSLSIPSFRCSVSCIFSTIGAVAELRFFNKRKSSRLVPVAKLYDTDGNFLYAEKAMISKVRIPFIENQYAQLFKTVEPPIQKENTSLSVGLQYTVSQGNIALPTVCISFPRAGFLVSDEIENRINSINLPANPKTIIVIAEQIGSLVKRSCPLASDLQIERTKRLFEKILYDINTRYMAG